jgi:uncharacterized protein with PIN domain
MSSHLHTPAGEVHESFTVCTVCMRVLRGAGWVEVEEVIREVRSFELTLAPSLESGMCPDCNEAIALRRAA